jgi:hypothetical protein
MLFGISSGVKCGDLKLGRVQIYISTCFRMTLQKELYIYPCFFGYINFLHKGYLYYSIWGHLNNPLKKRSYYSHAGKFKLRPAKG